MKITFLTPGTGSYYCGACMRDNVLAKELYRQGEDAAILPMYLPLVLDEEALPGLEDTPIFFGGINIFSAAKDPAVSEGACLVAPVAQFGRSIALGGQTQSHDIRPGAW